MKNKIDQRVVLLELRREIENGMESRLKSEQIVGLDQSRVGRLSRMDALQGQAMAKALNDRQRRTLSKIALALHELDTGDYGLCKQCGEPIALARLNVDPLADCCIECATRLENI